MKRYDKLIFVSTSDTATAPMAEAIMQSKFLLEDLLIESKGLVVLFPEPINQKAEAILASNGLSMKDHMSEPLLEEDFDERTLVLVLEEAHKSKIYQEFANVKNLHSLNEYVGESGELENPYGGSLQEYGKCFETLDGWIKKLVIKLNEEELLC